MNEKRFIELQLGAAKAKQFCADDMRTELDGSKVAKVYSALCVVAAAEGAHWQSKLDELTVDAHQQPFDVFDALKKASEWVAPTHATASKEANP